MFSNRIFGLVVFVCIASNEAKSANTRRLRDASESDTFLTPLEIIRKNGYPSEAHIVQSQDGYFTELHRIPHGKSGLGDKKRIPILIHHGLLSSSMDWIMNGPNKSLGYRLADEGYDLWLANARGNRFSRSHVAYRPHQKEFWNFSFHETGLYDLPASIDHILNVTGQDQIIYIGHSLGTSAFYAMASLLPEYNTKIKFQISLAPVASISHATSAYRLLVPRAKMMIDMVDWYNRGAFLESDPMTKMIMNLFQGDINVLNRIFGEDTEQFNPKLFPIIAKNFLSGTSGKNLIHCAQLISSGTFSQYDYGKVENMKKYGSKKPPKYNINKINVPIRFYYGENDLLATPTDTKALYQKLSKPLGLQKVNYEKFNHVDFLWAKDINKLLNDDIIEFINNSTDSVNGSDFIQDTIDRALPTTNKTKSSALKDVSFDKEEFLSREDKEINEFSSLLLALHSNNDRVGFEGKNRRSIDRMKMRNFRITL